MRKKESCDKTLDLVLIAFEYMAFDKQSAVMIVQLDDSSLSYAYRV